jgi:hypothetical protein
MNKPDTTLAELQAWHIAEHATKVSANGGALEHAQEMRPTRCATVAYLAPKT